MQVAIDRCIESYDARLAPGDLPMNQVLLARALGLNQSTISRWQSGERAISLFRATRVAEVLSYPLEDLPCLPELCLSGITEVPSARQPSSVPLLAEEGA